MKDTPRAKLKRIGRHVFGVQEAQSKIGFCELHLHGGDNRCETPKKVRSGDSFSKRTPVNHVVSALDCFQGLLGRHVEIYWNSQLSMRGNCLAFKQETVNGVIAGRNRCEIAHAAVVGDGGFSVEVDCDVKVIDGQGQKTANRAGNPRRNPPVQALKAIQARLSECGKWSLTRMF